MVIFDVMTSHYNMLTWHEEALVNHAQELACYQVSIMEES